MEAIQPTKSLSDRAYEALVDAICTGELRPGERLTQDEIAERLNVSRQPVNSAIAMLKAQRFVIETGRRGVEVAPVDGNLFTWIYQIRSALEPLAVELATPRMTAKDIERGRELIATGNALMQAGDARGVLKADIDFHMHIHELSGNRLMLDMIQLNWQHLQRSMGEVLRFPGMTLQAWKEHRGIFDAMAAGDAAGAADLMRAHITEAPRRIARSAVDVI